MFIAIQATPLATPLVKASYLTSSVPRSESSRKTVSYEEQIMSKDKYPSIFSPQMVTIVFIILQIFFTTRAVLRIGEYSRIFPSWRIFGHVTRLDQSRASEKIWWIISSDICPLSYIQGSTSPLARSPEASKTRAGLVNFARSVVRGLVEIF